MNEIDIKKEVKKHSYKYLPTTIEGIARSVRLNMAAIDHLVADLHFIKDIIRYPSEADFIMANHDRVFRNLNEIELACQAALETLVHNNDLLHRLDEENGL